jgi:hypothetical protein
VHVAVIPFEIAQHVEGAVGAAVIDEQDLVPHIHAPESLAELLMQFAQGCFLIIEGDHHAQVDPLWLALLLGAALAALRVVWLWRRNGHGALLLDWGGLLVGHARAEMWIDKF